MPFRFRLLLLFLLSVYALRLPAQGDMRFFGTALKNRQPVSGATVTVLMDGKTQLYQLTTGKNGKFKFTVNLGHEYRLNFSAPGCVSMYMILNLKVPKEKGWIYPDYVADIPFFDGTEPNINTDLFGREPFIKVVYDGKSGFQDDPSWRFIDRVFKDVSEDKKRNELQNQKEREAEERARREAEERQRAEEDRKRLQAIREAEERQRAEDEARRLKAIAEARANSNPGEEEKLTVESEAIRLEREKQERLALEAKNKGIKAQYENNLLKLVAENEKRANMQKFSSMQREAQAGSVVQAMRLEAERKAQSDYLLEQEKQRRKQTLENKQVKANSEKKLVETAAVIERTSRIDNAKPAVQASAFRYNATANVAVQFEHSFFSDVKITTITWPGGKRVRYRMETWWWGVTYYYCDDKEIDGKTYAAEIEKHRKPAPARPATDIRPDSR